MGMVGIEYVGSSLQGRHPRSAAKARIGADPAPYSRRAPPKARSRFKVGQPLRPPCG